MSTSDRAHRRAPIPLVSATLITLIVLALLLLRARAGTVVPCSAAVMAATAAPASTPPLGFGRVLGARAAAGVGPTSSATPTGSPTRARSRRPSPVCAPGRP